MDGARIEETPLEVPILEVEAALEAARTPGAVVIDLRSESEFAEDHLEGAHSVPLFDDTQRAIVGTLFKQSSPEDAFRAGVEFVASGIDALLARIAELSGWEGAPRDAAEGVRRLTAHGLGGLEQGLRVRPLEAAPEAPVILHCWRGGLRSQSVIGFCRALGLERVVGVAGGYKAYRRRVLDTLDAWSAPPSFVLRGLTGVGKTLVLRALEELEPGWTIDLEGCAGHRSSLLGMVGLAPCSQKTFETRLFERVRAGFPGPCVFEGESRKVGDAIVPRALWEALAGGVNIAIRAPLERRIQVLADDYLAVPSERPRLARQLAQVEERLHGKFPLVALLEADRIDELVEVLLEHYYDPLYRHSEKGREYAVTFESTDEDETAREVRDWIRARS